MATLARAYAPDGPEERLLRARLETLRAERERYLVRSQVAGTVLRRFIEPGDVAQPGRALLEIAADGPVEAICQAEERQLARLSLAQPAWVVPDALPELRAEAVLSFIAPAVDPTTGAIELRFRLLDPPAALRQDMTVSVEVETARLEQALVVPNEALGGPDGRRIRVVREGRVEELTVEVLARGLERSAIAGPLSSGERVLVYAERRRPGNGCGCARALMPLRFEALLALRLLREGRVQTWLILAGIAVGVAVIVFVTALIAGLQASIIERTLGTQAHIKIVPPEERALRALAAGEAEAIAIEQRAQRLRSIGNWPALLAALRQDRDILAAAPIVSGPALARRGAASRAVALLGIEPESYLRIVPTHEKLQAGRFDLSGDQVLIGSLLAADLGAKPGERLRLETSGERARTVTVAGIFELGVRDLDQRLVYLGLKPAQSLLDLPAGITGIDLKVQEIFAAERIARRLQAALGVQAESWMQTNRNLLDALAAQSSSTRLISFFVAISAAFGIASVLAVSVVQKTREIGILRAVG